MKTKLVAKGIYNAEEGTVMSKEIAMNFNENCIFKNSIWNKDNFGGGGGRANI